MKEFEQTSIIGRYAYALKCLEIALEKYDINHNLLDKIIDKAWEFTTSDSLDEWQYEIMDFNPNGFEQTNIDELANNYFSFNETEIIQLKKIYKDMPDFIIQIFNYTFWIAYEHLYSIVPKNSPKTLEYLSKIIQLMKENQLDTPLVDKYISLTILHGNGWGQKTKREYFN